MILPSDHWCSVRYFTNTIDNQGKIITVNDYESAFREDMELSNVVSKIGEIMAENGYPVKDYMQEYKSLIDEDVEEMVTTSTKKHWPSLSNLLTPLSRLPYKASGEVARHR